MFRPRVLYLWLHMIAAFCALLLILVGADILAALLSDSDELKMAVLLALLPFSLVMGACALAIFGSFLILLLQWLLISVEHRCGQPTSRPFAALWDSRA